MAQGTPSVHPLPGQRMHKGAPKRPFSCGVARDGAPQ